jgi:hypothetical protein
MGDMKKTAYLITMVLAGGLFGCRAAEPVRLGVNVISGSGGIFISTGTGGAVGSGGTGGLDPTGSGGVTGTGGSGEDAGPPVVDAGSGGTGGSELDSGALDTGAGRDVAVARDLAPPGPTTRHNCYVIPRYAPNVAYMAGDRVFKIDDLRVYQCRPWPYTGWCSQQPYEPGGPTGYWPNAWIHVGYCE